MHACVCTCVHLSLVICGLSHNNADKTQYTHLKMCNMQKQIEMPI